MSVNESLPVWVFTNVSWPSSVVLPLDTTMRSQRITRVPSLVWQFSNVLLALLLSSLMNAGKVKVLLTSWRRDFPFLPLMSWA